MKTIGIFGFFLWLTLTTSAQSHRTCGAPAYLQKQLATHQGMQQRRDSLELYTENFVARYDAQNKSSITIPVVVHVIWSLNVQNISDAQIQSQIAVLNEDYNRQNSDTALTPALFKGVAAACDIHFCLARRDPTGQATTGITRTHSSKAVFDMSTDDAKYSAQGGHDSWDASRYLNIWVVPSITDGITSDILGYATMPGGPAAVDGVVIRYLNFGRTGTLDPNFNLGRTGTHEVGHWLNLIHIWGDDGGTCSGSDLVNDTPNQEDENYYCPNFPSPSCNNTSDMFSNYMDYTDDNCMNIFTAGQKARMWAAINGYRASLKTSDGCLSVGIAQIKETANIKIYPNPAGHILHIKGLQDPAQLAIFNNTGRVLLKTPLKAKIENTLDISSLTAGPYVLRIETNKTLIFKKLIII